MSRDTAGYPGSGAAEPPLLVGHLMASAPPRSTGANAASIGLSIAGHVLALALAIWLTTGRTTSTPRPPGFDIYLPPDPAPPPVAPPPALPQEAGPASVVSKPGTFPVLRAPIDIPTEIPLPTPGPATNEGAFTAQGTEEVPGGNGPTGPAATPTEPNPGDFVPTTVNPELKNRAAIERALLRAYPPMLRDAGVSGSVLVWVLVDENGAVIKTQVKESSSVSQLDEAALGVAAQMRFSPAMNRDQRVKVWVAVPIRFRVSGD